MSDADLIQRLFGRDDGPNTNLSDLRCLCLEAADAIERLTRERDEAQERQGRAEGRAHTLGEKCHEWMERALAAEAREAKLREALAVYANPEAWRLAGNNVPALHDAGELARTALTAKAEKGS